MKYLIGLWRCITILGEGTVTLRRESILQHNIPSPQKKMFRYFIFKNLKKHPQELWGIANENNDNLCKILQRGKEHETHF